MDDPASESPVITEVDLRALDQRALLRALDVVRRLTVVLFVVAGLLFAAWVWSVLRNQGVIDSGPEGLTPFGFGTEDPSLQTRVDILAATVNQLAFAAAVAGIALGIRAYCEVATLNAGGKLTGWELGDPVEPELVDLEETS